MFFYTGARNPDECSWDRWDLTLLSNKWACSWGLRHTITLQQAAFSHILGLVLCVTSILLHYLHRWSLNVSDWGYRNQAKQLPTKHWNGSFLWVVRPSWFASCLVLERILTAVGSQYAVERQHLLSSYPLTPQLPHCVLPFLGSVHLFWITGWLPALLVYGTCFVLSPGFRTTHSIG